MIKYWMVLACVGALGGCGELVDTRSAKEQLPDVVRGINQAASSEWDEIFPGAVMKARIEEGDTLVLMLSNVPTGSSTFDPNVLRKAIRPQVCGTSEFRSLIDGGGKVRLEMTSNFGKELPAIQIARC